MSMDDKRLAEIRERVEKAEPGPWTHYAYGPDAKPGPYIVAMTVDEEKIPGPARGYTVTCGQHNPSGGTYWPAMGTGGRSWDQAEATAVFIAHARTGYPAALLALKAAMEQIEGMKQWGLALAIIAANEPIGSSAHTIAMEGISKAAAHAKAGKTQEVPNE